MHHQEGTFQSSDDLRLYYQFWRPETPIRAVLVAIHGMGGHSGLFGNVVKALVPKGYAVYTYDARGNGRSPGQRGYINAWSEFREDLRLFLQWVRSQEPDSPVFLLGHSVGAVVVLDYGLRCLEEAKTLQGVIISAPIIGSTGVSPIKVWIGQLLSNVYPRFSLSTGLDSDTGARDLAIVEGYRKDPLRHSQVTARFGSEFLATVAWIQAHAADWQLPLLILLGGSDRVALPDGGRRFFQNAGCLDKEQHEYPDTYHEIFDDLDRQQVLADLENWLERHLSPTMTSAV
ncbi:lysophospholipase [Oscillatoria sp. FACHB-1407]|uniref:alpha/beta hydrolase n=1 Tax=Oscillatoria sp. FACHB-1407 TaxID=2692847 RepID=UPI00168448C0|nr:alpha/beta hydrolase [Oscillatoria sp. FACHB-1407]MBD2461368.1 lysophospholipase [Oscillatoria sp. FACHB-1407]